eukprot:1796706-Rhodomonas_salina.2
MEAPHPSRTATGMSILKQARQCLAMSLHTATTRPQWQPTMPTCSPLSNCCAGRVLRVEFPCAAGVASAPRPLTLPLSLSEHQRLQHKEMQGAAKDSAARGQCQQAS